MKKTLALIAVLAMAVTTYAQAATFKATLTWVDNSTNEDGFRIERSAGPGQPFSSVGTVAANVVSFVDQPLTAGASFCWRVIAFNVAGDSLPSPTACAATPSTPAAPGTLQVVITIAP